MDAQETPQDTPVDLCIACDSGLVDGAVLVKPCRNCGYSYCYDCIREMFTAATSDPSRMPPRCCTFLQIHTAFSALTHQEATDYRAKFEEWVGTNKTYCPSQKCSAFIPDRLLPTAPNSPDTPTLQHVLDEVVKKVMANPLARFFRGDQDLTQLPGYMDRVKAPIDLGNIKKKLDGGKYSSAARLTDDMALLSRNATSYYSSGHPVSTTASDLFDLYLHDLSIALDQVVERPPYIQSTQSMFTCPTCHIGICVSCKQIEHGTKACDTTTTDHEAAILATFRYKRCPACKHAVRKMFGCSHMQCICGAHWCYYCCKAIDRCDGACENRVEEDSEMDDDDEIMEDDMEEEDDEERADPPDGLSNPNVLTADHPIPIIDHPDAGALTVPPSGLPTNMSTTLPTTSHIPVNLDTGGARRWAETDLDFGSEPEDEPFAQVWSCRHIFEPYETLDDGCNHGDLNRMECNWCCEKVIARVVSLQDTELLPGKKRKRVESQDVKKTGRPPKGGLMRHRKVPQSDTQAMECKVCRLVLCQRCCEKRKSTVE